MASWANREVGDPCEREAVMRASRIFVSSLFATISAALPLAERMKGTCPASGTGLGEMD